MTAVVPSTAVGVFHDHQMAESAVQELIRAGFRPDQVGVAARQPGGIEMPELPAPENKAEEGGLAGLLGGGVLGGLLGAGAVAAGLVPGIGPVLGAGILAAIISGITTGALAGGLVGALIGMGIPEEEAKHYQAEFEAGRTIVTVKADGRYQEAIDILSRWGAHGKGSPLV